MENLEKKGYDAIFKFPYNINGESNIKKMINRDKIDGLIIMHSSVSPEDMEVIRKSKIPSVFLHVMPKNFSCNDIDFFTTDHVAGGYMAAKHLYSKGFKKYTILTAMPGESEFAQRTEGFIKYLTEKGSKREDVDIILGDITFEYGKKIAKEYKNKFKERGVFVS